MKFKRAKSLTAKSLNQTIPDGGIAEKTWELIDETISQTDIEALKNTLLSSKQARESYIDAVDLHMDLLELFADPSANT